VDGHRETARNRGGRHYQHIRFISASDKLCALHNPESMLLVDDDEAEFGELHVLLNQRVSAYGEIYFAVANRRLKSALFTRRKRSCKQFDSVWSLRKEPFQIARMLFGQNLGRHHKSRLIAVLNRNDDRLRGDYCFTRTHVALQEPIHWVRRGEIV